MKSQRLQIAVRLFVIIALHKVERFKKNRCIRIHIGKVILVHHNMGSISLFYFPCMTKIVQTLIKSIYNINNVITVFIVESKSILCVTSLIFHVFTAYKTEQNLCLSMLCNPVVFFQYLTTLGLHVHMSLFTRVQVKP